jgi:hypothetical protein
VRLELADTARRDARSTEDALRSDLAAAHRLAVAADQDHFRQLHQRLQRCAQDAYRHRLKDQMLARLMAGLAAVRAVIPAVAGMLHGDAAFHNAHSNASAAALTLSALSSSSSSSSSSSASLSSSAHGIASPWTSVALLAAPHHQQHQSQHQQHQQQHHIDTARTALSDPAWMAAFSDTCDGLQALMAGSDASSSSSSYSSSSSSLGEFSHGSDAASSSSSSLSLLSDSEAVAAATAALDREVRRLQDSGADALRRLDGVKDEAERWRVAAEVAQRQLAVAQQHEVEMRNFAAQVRVWGCVFV